MPCKMSCTRSATGFEQQRPGGPPCDPMATQCPRCNNKLAECDFGRDTGISFDDFVDALYEARWRSLCDAQHTEIEKLWRKLWPQN